MKIKMFSLIAVFMLAFSVSVSAETDITSTGVGEVAADKAADQSVVMAVNPGDTITISVTGAADKITLISYKGNTPDAANMQYINQYPKDTQNITYTVREIDNTQNGLYLLMINDGTNVSSFYYKVGRPVLSKESEGVNYYKRVDFGSEEGQTPTIDEYMGTTSVAYLASFTPAGGTVSRYGFSVKKTETSTETIS